MTSTQLVQNEINRFLSDDAPEVLCISGEWGIGKTFTWQKLLGDAEKNKTLGVKRHSYVSLFGLNSLEALKLSIAENSKTTVFGNQLRPFKNLGFLGFEIPDFRPPF
jgi:hypothetical protein